jgi:hypothetical protein
MIFSENPEQKRERERDRERENKKKEKARISHFRPYFFFSSLCLSVPLFFHSRTDVKYPYSTLLLIVIITLLGGGSSRERE